MGEPETGESTRAIYARMDDQAWQRILPLLRAGGRLTKPPRASFYYVGDQGGLTPARIRKLVSQGTIRRVGVETYALIEASDG